MQEGRSLSLLCRVRDVLCAIPVEHVEETMRPLPVESIAGVPVFVRGLAVVRGVPTPVVDAASLLSGVASHPTRFVTVRTGTRRVVLAVDAVVGIIEIPPDAVDVLPPLFQSNGLDAISAIGVLDADLLLVLRSTRLVPDDVWATIQSGGTAA